MKILHYTLGLPPYRSGGLTRYTTDLMLAQSIDNEVSLLYPGGLGIFSRNKKAISCKQYNKISVYKIMNAVPVPLLFGIKNPKTFIGNKNKWSNTDLEDFYNRVHPEVFHIHTLMGLPLELVLFFKKKKVKIVYTTHDYFGLCLKVNFINYQGKICNNNNYTNCSICNQNSPSNFSLRMRNIELFHKIKNYIPNNIRNNELKYTKNRNTKITQTKLNSYNDLIKYYREIFSLIDIFHFNSTITKNIFSKYIKIENSRIIPITHNLIKDRRKERYLTRNNVRIGFIGSDSQYKGLPILINTLKDIYYNGYKNWELLVYGNSTGVDKECSKIIFKGRFNSSQLEYVYNDLDLIIVPSICPETFNFITLEAISYGIPCLVSNNVGAKDIINKIDSYFIFDISELKSKLIEILSNKNILNNFNKKLLNIEWDFKLEKHNKDIINLYSV